MLGVLFTVAGFVMLVLEVVRVLTGSVLGGVGSIVLWTGLGLLALGLILLVVSVAVAGPRDTALPAEQEMTDEPAVVAPPKPATPRKKASAPASRRQPADTAPAPRPRARRATGPAPAATTEDPPPSS